jgi:serralysin
LFAQQQEQTMATTFISTVQTAAVFANSSDNIFVTKAGAILVSSGTGIKSLTGTSSAIDVNVSGEIVALSYGVNLSGSAVNGDNSSYGLNTLTVQASGQIVAGTTGAGFFGLGNNLVNLGSITGDQTGASFDGGDNTITNSGTLVGRGSTGLGFYGQGLSEILVGTGNYIDNSGTINGAISGISANYASLFLTNTGTISATGISIAAKSVGIQMVGVNAIASIINYGTISGGASAKSYSVFSEFNDVSIVNYGALIGTADLGAGFDKVVNSGTITGDVLLGTFDDTYQGFGNGLVTGNVDGGDGQDRLVGGALSDRFAGGLGNDVLKGGGGDDTLAGDAGADVLKGGAGNDALDGGADDDVLKGGEGNDVLSDTSGNDKFWGGSGDDTITGGNGLNAIYGGRGDDTLAGGGGIDLIYGGNGNDVIYGDKGKDVLYGGDGNDVIDGGGKDDVIHGGGGNDIMTGSSGADIFVFTQRAGDDVITDFTNNSDKLDLSGFGIASAADVVAASSTVTGGVLIDLDSLGGSGSIFLQGFSAMDLDSSDFIL